MTPIHRDSSPCPWCREHMEKLTPEQREYHRLALEYYRKNLNPKDVRSDDPFPEKEER